MNGILIYELCLFVCTFILPIYNFFDLVLIILFNVYNFLHRFYLSMLISTLPLCRHILSYIPYIHTYVATYVILYYLCRM